MPRWVVRPAEPGTARTVERVEETRKGALYGAAAYVLWGLFPLYWPLLEPSGSLEVLAHRVLWSLGVVAVLLAVAAPGPRRCGPRCATAARCCASRSRPSSSPSTGAPTSTASRAARSSRPRSATSSTPWSPCCSACSCSASGCGRCSGARSAWPGSPSSCSASRAAGRRTSRCCWRSPSARTGCSRRPRGSAPVEGLGIETAVLAPVAAVYLRRARGAGRLDLRRTTAAGHAVLLALVGPRHRGPAAAVRRRGAARADDDARAAAVPRPDDPVPARRAAAGRADGAAQAARVRRWCGRRWRSSRTTSSPQRRRSRRLVRVPELV